MTRRTLLLTGMLLAITRPTATFGQEVLPGSWQAGDGAAELDATPTARGTPDETARVRLVKLSG